MHFFQNVDNVSNVFCVLNHCNRPSISIPSFDFGEAFRFKANTGVIHVFWLGFKQPSCFMLDFGEMIWWKRVEALPRLSQLSSSPAVSLAYLIHVYKSFRAQIHPHSGGHGKVCPAGTDLWNANLLWNATDEKTAIMNLLEGIFVSIIWTARIRQDKIIHLDNLKNDTALIARG